MMKNKSSDGASDQSMHFWGICCESGKQYAQVVGQRFRITMAVLDPNSSSKEDSEKTVSLIVIRGGIEYLLCVLKHEEIHQVNLNLIFDKGENVTFYIKGYGKVCLSGYQLTDSESDVLNDEIGYLCPLVEVKSSKSREKKNKAIQKIESELVTPKSIKKTKAEKDKNKNGEIKILDLEDESDESDEDFSVGDEESESDDESEDFDEEDELEDEELNEVDNEEEEQEMEMIPDSKGSRNKRKISKIVSPHKRLRNDSITTLSSKSEDVVCIEDNDSNDKDSSDSDLMNSSLGNTPMPKKQVKIEPGSEKKKSKKKKSLSEASNVSEKSLNKSQMKSPVAGSTVNSPENTPFKRVVLEGGVEYQDVVIGRGPVATKGKMVHVYYIGRLRDKTVFDSRTSEKKPFSFKLGNGQVIKGWDIALQGMKVGGKRKLRIPPSMGYGNAGVGTIPPNSELFFIVELQAVS